MSKNKHHFSGGAWHTQIVVQVMIQNFFFVCVCGVCVRGQSFTTQAQYLYSGQYGSNDLPRPRRSALSECF